MSADLINNIATLAGVIVAILGAFIFAFWVAMGIWTFNDIRTRTRDWLAIVLAVLLVLIFPIVGLLLYTMIRPKITLADVYDRALEEEALLRELEETVACPTCGTPAKEAWVFCPNCHSQLQHSCPACSNLVRNEWEICVYCGAQQTRSTATPRERTPQLNSAPPLLQGQLSSAPVTQVQAPLRRRTARNPLAREAPPTAPSSDPDDTLYRPSRASD